MTNTSRLEVAEIFARALRRQERSATRYAAKGCAEDVVFRSGPSEVKGRDAVLEYLDRIWPFSTVYPKGIWSPAEMFGEAVIVKADFEMFGAAPKNYVLTFGFNDNDKIASVTEAFDFSFNMERHTEMPAYVRSLLNRALDDEHPVIVSYVADDGSASISARGSIQVFGPLSLCAWIRDAKGGLVRAVQEGRPVSLFYCNLSSRTILTMHARGRIAADDATRQRVFDLSPDVEQTHDMAQAGAALILDIGKMTGWIPQGGIQVEPTASPHTE